MDRSLLIDQRTSGTMGTRISLGHTTTYTYDREVKLGPHLIRLRPAPHSRTPISDYSLKVRPQNHRIHWQFDAGGSPVARVLFNEKVRQIEIQVDLVAELRPTNPFDFFLEPSAENFPFEYDPSLDEQLLPYRLHSKAGPRLREYVESIDVTPRNTIEFLVGVNKRLKEDVRYVLRMEPGVQTTEETLELGRGSCRDSALLLMYILRNLGFAARFTSGYLVQLKVDEPEDDNDGPDEDGAELHAWTEVYLPGAGWIGLDATSGLLAAEGHIPLASASHPDLAAPVSGTVGPCHVDFRYILNVARLV